MDAFSQQPMLTLEGANAVLAAALEEAVAIGTAVCIVVSDLRGEPVAMSRMDGAPVMALGIATNKAFTVCGFNGMPTRQWWRAIGDDPSLVHGLTHTPRLTIFAGGVGIFHDGRLAGAIGVSGGSPEEDEAVASAGVAALPVVSLPEPAG